MAIPVNIVSENGHYRASVYGIPVISAEGPTRETALLALNTRLRQEELSGELAWLPEPSDPSDCLAGLFAGDKDILDEIVANAFANRDRDE